MSKKIEGLEVISRDSKRGSAEYMYKGVRISKYTQELGHKTRIRGVYSRAGIKFTFKISSYHEKAIVPTNYMIVKNYTLKDTVNEINRWLEGSTNRAVEKGTIINGVSDREALRACGKISA